MSVTIWHNPACSKSRATLALLKENGVDASVVEYLKTPPDEATLRGVLAKQGISPRQLLRTGEDEYKALGLADATLTDDALIAAMVAHPKLIERPVVVNGDKAAIGRPPESVLAIL